MAKKFKNAVVPTSVRSPWDGSIGLLACLVLLFVPFFPDEKLIRLKMQMLEFGLLGLVGLIGIRVLLASSFPFTRKWHPVWLLSAAVAGWALVQIFLWFMASEKSLASNELRRVLLGAAAYFAFAMAALSEKWHRRVLVCWALSGGLLAAYGCLQFSGGMAWVQVPKMERVMGTFGNPIFFAAYLSTTFFITMSALSRQTNTKLKLLFFVCLVFQITALYYTKTRGAWLGFVGAILLGLYYKLQTKSVPKWIFLVILVGGGLFTYNTRNVWERDQGHLLIWRDTLRMWVDHPVMGVGLGAFHTVFPSYAQDDLKSKWPQGKTIVNYAHNEYLQLLAETGVVGFMAFMVVLACFFWIVHRHRDDEVNFLAMAATTLLIQNLFSVDMRFGISLALFFIILGMTVASVTPIEEKWVAVVPSWTWPIQLAGITLWSACLGLVVWPYVIRPYRAQKIVSETPSFFNERLLDPAKSIQDLEKLAHQFPNETAVLEKLAYVYAKEMKTVDDKINVDRANAAISTYEKLISLDPSRAGAVNNLANINYTMGRTTEAIRLWRRCVELEPTFLDAHLNLGKTLYVRGELKESAAHFEKVLKLNPGNPEAIVYLKKMVE